MPVTAKLSRKFYETFGDDIANEFVEWFNQVDTTYRGDLRELNELNFSRFDARLEQRFAQQDAKWEQRFAQQDAKWEQRFAQQDAKWEQRFAQQDVKWERRFADLDVKLEHRFLEQDVKWEQRFSEVDAKLHHLDLRVERVRSELLRWMFVFWIGTVGPLLIAKFF